MSVESVELLRRENEKRILRAVKALMNEQNTMELSLGAIARRAGVAVRTINNIFGTKNSLLLRTAISAYREEQILLDEMVASPEFIEKSGLEQVMALHYERARLQREYPYVSRVVSEIERMKLAGETETGQCDEFLRLVDSISLYYEGPIEKGHRDGSIRRNLGRAETQSILVFLFGAITQRLQSISSNALMNRRVDSYATLRTVLAMTRDYIGT